MSRDGYGSTSFCISNERALRLVHSCERKNSLDSMEHEEGGPFGDGNVPTHPRHYMGGRWGHMYLHGISCSLAWAAHAPPHISSEVVWALRRCSESCHSESGGLPTQVEDIARCRGSRKLYEGIKNVTYRENVTVITKTMLQQIGHAKHTSGIDCYSALLGPGCNWPMLFCRNQAAAGARRVLADRERKRADRVEMILGGGRPREPALALPPRASAHHAGANAAALRYEARRNDDVPCTLR